MTEVQSMMLTICFAVAVGTVIGNLAGMIYVGMSGLLDWWKAKRTAKETE